MGRSATPSGASARWPVIAAWSIAAAMLLALRPGLSGRDAAGDDLQSRPPLIAYPRVIEPGLSILGGLSPSAAYAIATSEGIVLVDSGLRSDAGALKSQLAVMGGDWKSVRAVLITHAHIDHSGGAEHLRAAAGAKVYAGAGDAGVLRAGTPHEAFFSAFSLPGGELHPTHVDVELRGGESLTFGDTRIRAIAAPGHTPGSMCFLLERDGRRALFTGDVISMLLGDEKSPNRVAKALGTYSAYLPPRYRGDAASYLATLRTLRAMPVPDIVLPGHPRGDPTPQFPMLSQARWEEILDRGIADMTTLLARYQADGADFLDGNPRPLLPDLYYLGDFRDAAVYAFFASSKLYLVDAPGGPGLLAFVRERLRQLGRDPAEPAAVLLTSCDEVATAGLRELVESCHPQVVASAAGLPALKAACPAGTTLLPAEPWSRTAPFEGTTMTLHGYGVAPIAYRIRWAGKTVLFSGRILSKLKLETGSSRLPDLSGSKETTLDYLFSLYRLGDPAPDLWLPTFPVDGQNANLYDSEWQDILADYYRIGYRGLMGR